MDGDVLCSKRHVHVIDARASAVDPYFSQLNTRDPSLIVHDLLANSTDARKCDGSLSKNLTLCLLRRSATMMEDGLPPSSVIMLSVNIVQLLLLQQ